jgi:hypothetical protein
VGKPNPETNRRHSYSLTITLPKPFTELSKIKAKDTMVLTMLDSMNGPLLVVKKLNDENLKGLEVLRKEGLIDSEEGE